MIACCSYISLEKNYISPTLNVGFCSFNNETKSAIIGNAITFTDTSGVLSKYQIHNSDGATSSISGNTLTVIPNKTGEVVVVEGMLTLYEGAEVKDISGNVAPKEKE